MNAGRLPTCTISRGFFFPSKCGHEQLELCEKFDYNLSKIYSVITAITEALLLLVMLKAGRIPQ